MSASNDISNDKLTEIADLARAQLGLESKISLLEQELETLKSSYKNLSEVLLPDAMHGVGLSEFSLADGTSVCVTQFYSAKIPDDRASEAFAWLRKTGNDSIIKREVRVNFGKGEDADAQIAVEALRDLGHEPQDKSSVHPQTLKSFVRERLESAQELPIELFGVFVGNKTKLTPAK